MSEHDHDDDDIRTRAASDAAWRARSEHAQRVAELRNRLCELAAPDTGWSPAVVFDALTEAQITLLSILLDTPAEVTTEACIESIGYLKDRLGHSYDVLSRWHQSFLLGGSDAREAWKARQREYEAAYRATAKQQVN